MERPFLIYVVDQRSVRIAADFVGSSGVVDVFREFTQEVDTQIDPSVQNLTVQGQMTEESFWTPGFRIRFGSL